MNFPLFEVKELKASYRNDKPIFSDINISINYGELITLIGDNGSGKSTFIRAIIRSFYQILPDIVGKIIFMGNCIKDLSNYVRSGDVGIMYQERFIFPKLSVNEHIKIALRKCKFKSERINQLFLQIPDLFDLQFAYSERLSGGERALLSLGMAIVSKPKLLLLDEPFANLDEKHKSQLCNLILKLKNEEKVGILIIEHKESILKGLHEKSYKFSLGKTPQEIKLGICEK